MSHVEKLLTSSRAVVALLSITMGFTIAIYSRIGSSVEEKESPTTTNSQIQEVIDKLDSMVEEGRMRDMVILQQTLRLQHAADMHLKKNPLCPDCNNNAPIPRIAKKFEVSY